MATQADTPDPMPGLWIRDLSGCCPVQAEGTMEGRPFYFRAREGDWELTVVEPGVDVIDASIAASLFGNTKQATLFHHGDDDTWGYMAHGPIMAILEVAWQEIRCRVTKGDLPSLILASEASRTVAETWAATAGRLAR